MSDLWSVEGATAERRRRVASATVEQRFAWLRRMQEFAYETGALQRARDRKAREQEDQWKSAKR